MGDMVDIPAARGYLATPAEGAGLGVVVIQEWCGVDDHIRDVCDRLAAEGFTALAPDLDAGEVPKGEPGEAGAVRAAPELSGAVDFLLAHPAMRGHTVGVVGFGTGGGLALWLATLRPDAVAAAVPFYGRNSWGPAPPDYSRLAAAVEGHYAEVDDLAGPPAARALSDTLTGLGKEVKVFLYPGTRHAFFDDTRPEVYDEEAARTAWVRTLEFLRAKLG